MDGVDLSWIEQRGQDSLHVLLIKPNGVAIGKLLQNRFDRFNQGRNVILLCQFQDTVIDAQIIGAQGSTIY